MGIVASDVCSPGAKETSLGNGFIIPSTVTSHIDLSLFSFHMPKISLFNVSRTCVFPLTSGRLDFGHQLGRMWREGSVRLCTLTLEYKGEVLGAKGQGLGRGGQGHGKRLCVLGQHKASGVLGVPAGTGCRAYAQLQ